MQRPYSAPPGALSPLLLGSGSPTSWNASAYCGTPLLIAGEARAPARRASGHYWGGPGSRGLEEPGRKGLELMGYRALGERMSWNRGRLRSPWALWSTPARRTHCLLLDQPPTRALGGVSGSLNTGCWGVCRSSGRLQHAPAPCSYTAPPRGFY